MINVIIKFLIWICLHNYTRCSKVNINIFIERTLQHDSLWLIEADVLIKIIKENAADGELKISYSAFFSGFA